MFANEKRLKSVFENCPVGIPLINNEGNILKENQAILDMSGYTEEEIPGKNFADFTHPDDLEESILYFQIY